MQQKGTSTGSHGGLAWRRRREAVRSEAQARDSAARAEAQERESAEAASAAAKQVEALQLDGVARQKVVMPDGKTFMLISESNSRAVDVLSELGWAMPLEEPQFPGEAGAGSRAARACDLDKAAGKAGVTIFEISEEPAADIDSGAGSGGQCCTITELTEEEAAAPGSSMAGAARQEAQPSPACNSGCAEDAAPEEKVLEAQQVVAEAGGAAEPDQAPAVAGRPAKPNQTPAGAAAPAAPEVGAAEALGVEAETGLDVCDAGQPDSGNGTLAQEPLPAPEDSPSRAFALPFQSLMLSPAGMPFTPNELQVACWLSCTAEYCVTNCCAGPSWFSSFSLWPQSSPAKAAAAAVQDKQRGAKKEHSANTGSNLADLSHAALLLDQSRFSEAIAEYQEAAAHESLPGSER
jgi:hypothetical protein